MRKKSKYWIFGFYSHLKICFKIISYCFLSFTVFNLTNNVDLENTKKKMEIYQKENKDVIQKNKLKLVGC